MFGTIKKAMVFAAVAGVGAAAAPAMASAGPVWNTSATSTIGAEAAHGAGELTFSVVIGGTARTTTCDVTATEDLWNGTEAGTTRGLGDVTTFQLGASAGGACTTNIPGCLVTTATSNTSTPWATTASTGGTVSITGISITLAYSGLLCPINGTSVTVTGSINGSMSGGTLGFINAAGLTSPFGPMTVSGEIEMLWEDDGAAVVLS
jgi:hypothetical protein